MSLCGHWLRQILRFSCIDFHLFCRNDAFLWENLPAFFFLVNWYSSAILFNRKLLKGTLGISIGISLIKSWSCVCQYRTRSVRLAFSEYFLKGVLVSERFFFARFTTPCLTMMLVFIAHVIGIWTISTRWGTNMWVHGDSKIFHCRQFWSRVEMHVWV